jgi:hypothetical protein
VVRALRSNGIDVTAIHSHMLAEEPRIIFLHFWANDDALKLARGLRAALDTTASAAQLNYQFAPEGVLLAAIRLRATVLSI